MSELNIRLGEEKDIHQCLEIYFREPFFEQYNPTSEGMRKLFQETINDQTQKFLVATNQEDKIRGFALFDLKGAFSRSGYLRLIVVDKKYQSQKIGEKIIHYIEQNLNNKFGFCLMVSHNNLKAQDFYLNLGFIKVGEIENYVQKGIIEFIFFKRSNN